MINLLKFRKYTWLDVFIHIYLPAICMISYACVTYGSPNKDVLIDTNQIAKALCAQGACISARDIAMGASVVSTKPNPKLEVLRTGETTTSSFGIGETPARLWVMLGCRGDATCTPFYVQVMNPPKALLDLRPLQHDSTAPDQSPKDALPSIHVGTLALLNIVRNQSRIQLRVITVGAGKVGDEVLVRSPDGKKTYKAKVLSPTMLEEVIR